MVHTNVRAFMVWCRTQLLGEGGLDLEACLRGLGGAPGAMLAMKVAGACVRVQALQKPFADAVFTALNLPTGPAPDTVSPPQPTLAAD